MVKNPNLNALKMFDAAARHLNFGLAADELNLTQGAVAQQVRKLEHELNVKLFHRLARGLALTEAGQNYSGAVRKAMRIIEDATQRLQTQNSPLTLSVPPSLASKWLVPRLKLFHQLYPEIDVAIVASEALANFKNDGVDLAIRMGVPPFANGLTVKLLALQRLCAVCNSDYAKKINKVEAIGDLAGYDLIHDHHSRWDDFLPALAGVGGGMRFNQTALAMDAALDGQGIALVPLLLAAADFETGKLIELWRNMQPSRTGYYIVFDDRDEVNPHRQAMINWLSVQVKN